MQNKLADYNREKRAASTCRQLYPDRDRIADVAPLRFRADSGPRLRCGKFSAAPLFDDLVGDGEQRRRTVRTNALVVFRFSS